MTESIVQVQNLGKRYRIGIPELQPEGMRETLKSIAGASFRYLRQMTRPPTDEETLWALRNVSFEVRQGEVLGVIGRNGAGKSTLLKILSRITEPTEGRAIINGRVGSLLEVGTGFHPELTGRENTYLNGAILGMKKKEIDLKFDEIVDFAEIEKFIDTPVKRYSSGMYVRLAFAVAAHLEPEILIVDEVLAVGDAAFQRKCLGKIENVAAGGRTILFVSHNMPSIESLCHRVMLVDEGRIVQIGTPDAAINQYLKNLEIIGDSHLDLSNHRSRTTPPEKAVFKYIRSLDSMGHETTQFKMGDVMEFEVGLDVGSQILNDPLLTIEIERRGVRICHLSTLYMSKEPFTLTGQTVVKCRWRLPLLMPGEYSIGKLVIKIYAGADRLDAIEQIMPFEILPTDVYGTGKLAPDGMLVVPEGEWEIYPQPALLPAQLAS
jgi:lipopolysaccharide transport system ATP-binding protein